MPPTKDDDQQAQPDDDDLDKLDDGTDVVVVEEDDETKTPAGDDAVEAKGEEESTEEESEGEPEVASKDNRMIPRSRFNEKNEEAKRLAAENAELRQQIGESPKDTPDAKNGEDAEESLFTDLAAATRAQKKAIEDDDEDGAIKANATIADINAKIVMARIGDGPTINQDEITSAAVDQMEWKNGLKQVYKDYPVLNANGKDADNALIQEVLDMQEALIAMRGQGKAESLQRCGTLCHGRCWDRRGRKG